MRDCETVPTRGDTGLSLAARPLLVVAVRTTGPDPVRHEIVELSAVRAHPTILFVERSIWSPGCNEPPVTLRPGAHGAA
jgi:hypothetical protein